MLSYQSGVSRSHQAHASHQALQAHASQAVIQSYNTAVILWGMNCCNMSHVCFTFDLFFTFCVLLCAACYILCLQMNISLNLFLFILSFEFIFDYLSLAHASWLEAHRSWLSQAKAWPWPTRIRTFFVGSWSQPGSS